jgi:hypothetical protein
MGPEIELKGTLVGLYDVYSASGQIQTQGTVQVHLGGPASLVIQGDGSAQLTSQIGQLWR